VRIIAPFAPGGAADTLGRLIAEQFTTAFRQQFYVENRGGAGGMIGAAAAAAAEPDGYTLVVTGIGSNVTAPVFSSNPGYDGLRDFTHIAYLGGPPTVTGSAETMRAASIKLRVLRPSASDRCNRMARGMSDSATARIHRRSEVGLVVPLYEYYGDTCRRALAASTETRDAQTSLERS
jgi:hypothetical protein